MTAPLAILGATSQLALDVLAYRRGKASLRLYARRPEAVLPALARRGIAFAGTIAPLESFGSMNYAGIVNFVGIGDPAKAAALGAGIFEATRIWDARALAQLERQPGIPYVFLSSGAVYGDAFAQPVDATSPATIPINALGAQHWYLLAKLHAEALHRAAVGRTIVDLRVFNIVSRWMDQDARFLLTDIVRAIADGTTFETNDVPMARDYLHPADLAALIEAALDAPAGTNRAIDAYSRAPITKAALLDLLAARFGLNHRVVPSPDLVTIFGSKSCYYSKNPAAAALGYRPTRGSAEAIVEEVAAMLAQPRAPALRRSA